MASYRLRIKPSALKELERIPAKIRRHAVARIQRLADEPRPAGGEKLAGADLYRDRQGSYRILYSVSDDAREIVVVKIGHRREVYR